MPLEGLLLANGVVFTRLGAAMRMVAEALSWIAEGFCVTGSVAVGTQRDGQDDTGRNSIIERYLA